MLWRLLFIALIGQGQCRCSDSGGDLINTTDSITSQSSNGTDNDQFSYTSVRATDRDKDLCAKTNDEQNPWWRIDLLGLYDISCVSIFNRHELNSNITGAQIHVGNSHENNGTNNKICANMINFKVKQWNDYTCTEQVSGRYVTVSFPGEKALNLCEVKIYGKRKDPINTISSDTSQSSNYIHVVSYSSGRATDGNELVCAHTKDRQGDHWWRIDLPGLYDISGVSIYNKNADNTDITGARIHVGNSRENNGTNNKMCANITNFNEGQWNDYTCTEQVSGRYVTVSFPGTKPLILCEVEIYGKKKGQGQCSCSDSAGDLINTTDSITSQSSNYTDNNLVSYSSGRATDGDENVCAHTQPGKGNHWWRIDLLGVYDIFWVSIYNKNGNKINGARIHVGNSRENNGTNNKICAEITDFKRRQWNDYTCTGQVSGRYLTVSLPGTRKLILCEVEIYGKKKGTSSDPVSINLINTTDSITSQSSDYTNEENVPYSSGRATDGNETVCAHTEDRQGDHWWRIDLPGLYDISGVSIYNKETHNTNMTGARIHIGNSRENNGINNKICANITNFKKGQWNDFKCTEQVSGHYINVSFPGKKPLILCEVKIYGKRKGQGQCSCSDSGDLINTTDSITSQSSNYTNEENVPYSSGRATDGNESVCAHTKEELGDHWWRIDLLGLYDISGVSIYNKETHNTDITGARIHVGNSHENNGINNKICANITNFNGGQWNDFKCTEQVSGHYINVSFPGTKPLVLCEVEIYGKKKEDETGESEEAEGTETGGEEGGGTSESQDSDEEQDLINTTNSDTSQSSNHTDNHSSGRATDGNEDACAHTKTGQQNPWWRIELLGLYDIFCVSIYNQYGNTINVEGAQIHVGNSRENNGTNNKMCANIIKFNGGHWNNFTCTEQVLGRYVTVFLPGTNFLVLCEVKIYGKRKDLINTANSITSQSSNDTDTQGSHHSVRATDGNETLCAKTNNEQNPWWRIDLLGVYSISWVSIYNGNTINVVGAQIHVGNSCENVTNNKMCTKITNFKRGEWNDFKCAEQVSGRYVTVSFPGKKALILCEVEIYGKKRASPFELIKEKKTWEHALEYCRERNMDLATILDEDDQTLAELEARNAKTRFLWLGLHYTCILEVWFWVADYRLEFNRWADGQKTGDCDKSAVMSRAEGHQWFSKSDYDEFNFICQKF